MKPQSYTAQQAETMKRIVELPLHNQLSCLYEIPLTDAEYSLLMNIAASQRRLRTPMITGVSEDWERGFGKGHDIAFANTLAEFPALAREVIAKANAA